MGDTELRSDRAAHERAVALDALAVTEGSTVAFAQGKLGTSSREQRNLLGHELTHVAQQRASHAGAQQRQEVPPDEHKPKPYPCTVDASSLTNGDLLKQLNDARIYLHTHTWGEDETYDWANLLRRLDTEKRQRIQGGQVWLAEHGLFAVPELLYTLNASSGTTVSVEKLDGSAVAGLPKASANVVITPAQFDVFLALQGIQTVDPVQYFASRDPNKKEPLSVELNPAERTAHRQPPLDPVDLLSPPERDVFFKIFPTYDPIRAPGPFAPLALATPFGLGGAGPFGEGEPFQYKPTAAQLLGELRESPGTLSGYGPDMVRMPVPRLPDGVDLGAGLDSSAGAGFGEAQPFLDNPETDRGPLSIGAGMGAFGYLGQPALPIPSDTSGVLATREHMSDFTMVNGRLIANGFRAGIGRHLFSWLERVGGAYGGPATRSLNRGVKGSYATDPLYALQPGAVVVFRADGGAVTPAQMVALMNEARARIEQDPTYRFHAPDPTSPAYADYLAAFGEQPPGFCPAGALNCVNQPDVLNVREQALGQKVLLPQGDGTILDLADPAHASARNAYKWATLPDEVLARYGLVRERVSGSALGGLGQSAALSMGAALAGDVLSGQDPKLSHLAVAGGGAVTGSMIESFAANRLIMSAVQAGVPLEVALARARLVGGPLSVALAPITTYAAMKFDDRQYTSEEYAGAMGRAGVGAAGGALATGVYFAIAGSEVPIAGNIVGFIVGTTGYVVTDLFVGESVEQGIRVGMGELGCDD